MNKTPTEKSVDILRRHGYTAKPVENGTRIEVQDPVQSSTHGRVFNVVNLHHMEVFTFLDARS